MPFSGGKARLTKGQQQGRWRCKRSEADSKFFFAASSWCWACTSRCFYACRGMGPAACGGFRGHRAGLVALNIGPAHSSRPQQAYWFVIANGNGCRGPGSRVKTAHATPECRVPAPERGRKFLLVQGEQRPLAMGACPKATIEPGKNPRVHRGARSEGRDRALGSRRALAPNSSPTGRQGERTDGGVGS